MSDWDTVEGSFITDSGKTLVPRIFGESSVMLQTWLGLRCIYYVAHGPTCSRGRNCRVRYLHSDWNSSQTASKYLSASMVRSPTLHTSNQCWPCRQTDRQTDRQTGTQVLTDTYYYHMQGERCCSITCTHNALGQGVCVNVTGGSLELAEQLVK